MSAQQAAESRIERIASELKLKRQQVLASLDLLEAGNTVPFLTRYRKEATGGLDEEQLRQVQDLHGRYRSIDERRETILNGLRESGRLDSELARALGAATSLSELEDLYLPYRPRRKTRAGIARQKGLAPLAGLLLARSLGRREIDPLFLVRQDEENQLHDLENPQAWLALLDSGFEASLEKAGLLLPGIPREDMLAGARDILAEWLSEQAGFKAMLRDKGRASLQLRTKLKEEHPDSARFRDYRDHVERLQNLPPHRLLAMNRGESLGCLQVKADWEALRASDLASRFVGHKSCSDWDEQVRLSCEEGLKRLLLPALERELRAEAQEKAEGHSLELYAANLKQLLLQPPLAAQTVMGIDPGFRTGCKVAVVDGTGRYLEGCTIYPHPPQNKQLKSRQELLRLAKEHEVQVVAVGNGTASRETQELVASWIAENKLHVRFTVVSEAGASIYSASEEAREEFPELEASLRGNISIARRLQDPLAELVKIDPKSLGVGQYQHDVDQRRLGEKLDQVVEDCVNAVGVNLNTASASLLRHVSGLTRRTSRNIVARRETAGPFKKREELRDVEGIGPAAFLQSAGFLRIRNGEEPLDNTGVHPERYSELRQLFERYNSPASEPGQLAGKLKVHCPGGKGLDVLAADLDLGLPTLQDILRELEKPGRDPREALDPPVMREALPDMEDLKGGEVLEGVVRNLTDFGAFVDVGLKQDGLVHVSQISRQRIRHPLDKLQVGQRIRVQVIAVDRERGRISLSMKSLEESGPAKGRNRDESRPRKPAAKATAENLAARFRGPRSQRGN